MSTTTSPTASSLSPTALPWFPEARCASSCCSPHADAKPSTSTPSPPPPPPPGLSPGEQQRRRRGDDAKDRQGNDIVWPTKLWELDNPHIDSSIWNVWKFRRGDIIIDTYIKTGTTLMQQIVGQLLFNGADDVNVSEISPWLDFAFYPREAMLRDMESQKHRRFVKTHLPLEALVISPMARYIYVIRDARDVVWSYHNHYKNIKPELLEVMNANTVTDGLTPDGKPSEDVRQFFLEWLHTDGYPLWPFFSHVRGWWEHRHLPNVLLVHFNNLKTDLKAEVQRVADFLDIDVEEGAWPYILEHCSLDWMRKHGDLVVPDGGTPWVGGSDTFLFKGTNGRWRDVLTPADIEEYEERVVAELGEECATWLATGVLPVELS